MIRISFLHAKTEFCRPDGWWLAEGSEKGFKGGIQAADGARSAYTANLEVIKNRTFEFSRCDWSNLETSICTDACRIDAEEGLPVLKNAPQHKDEIILLITLCGEQDDIIGKTDAVNGEILRQWKGGIRACPVTHIVARLHAEDGYVWTKIRRASCVNEVAIFSWQCQHFTMKLTEYNACKRNGISPLEGHQTIERELEEYTRIQIRRTLSRKFKESLKNTPTLKNLAINLKWCDTENAYEFQDDTYIFVRNRQTRRTIALPYSQYNLNVLTRKVERARAAETKRAAEELAELA